jgi:hypothetical protein
MSLLTVVNDVCAVVGVQIEPTVFGAINANRTMQEMLALANEMAQRISGDLRDWTMLKKSATLLGNGVTEAFNLPPDYRRILTAGNLWLSTSTLQPARFVPDTDEWLQRRTANNTNSWGEWTIYGGQVHIWPIMGVNASARFSYLDKNAVESRDTAGSFLQNVERFTADTDTFRLPERLLKLGMIWQWKAQKGSPYSEDLGTYQDAMTMAMGSDSPAPILIGRTPISANAMVAYPWTVPT